MSKLTKYDPFADLISLQKQFFNDDWMTPFSKVDMPTTDVYTKDDKELIIEAHLPNFEDKDIDVHVDDGTLVIQAEKHEKEEDKKKKYVVRESSSSFYRSVRLPQLANSDKIKAHVDGGVLKVVVPLKELPKPKKITISSKSNK
ncbi:Hsp20/alpha crystallin family protein [Candidatus Saccharibacteria bacterium]|nr:Hsp20/alpha crystallin family protein [Candidatus Saccharibacteria bacterium]